MEENKIVSPQIKGAIIGLIIVILSIVGYYTGMGFNRGYQWIVNGVMIVAVIFACIHFANQKEGHVTFGKVFMHGFMTTLVLTTIVLIYVILAFSILFPDMKEKIFEMQMQEMEKQNLDSDKIEQASAMMKKFFWPFMIMGVIFGNLIFGCIGSLIGAAVAKKNKANLVDQFPQ